MGKIVCAVITDGKRFLAFQRCRNAKYPFVSEKWEFPGGKVEEGEGLRDALYREIYEELDWKIFVGECLGTITHRYPTFDCELTAFLCRPGEGDFKLLEHLDSRWLTREELAELDWAEADTKILPLLP